MTAAERPPGAAGVPTFADVRAAASRLAGVVNRTPTVTSRSLDERFGTHLVFKCENLQRVGAFKYRGATNAVRLLDPGVAARGVCAHSSGNHAAALALAARTLGVPAHVVMPESSPAAKVAAVRAYGATVVRCASTLAARESTLARVKAETGAVEIHPYDNAEVIAGAGTAALELLTDHPTLDLVIAPVGGGGLLSGTGIATRGLGSARVIGAEPAAADDAARSLRSGRVEPSNDPVTIADGLRTSLSERTLAAIRATVDDIVTVSEDEIVATMRLMWERLKLVVEPSSAVALAAVAHLERPPAEVGVIISGGNLDLDTLPWQDHPT